MVAFLLNKPQVHYADQNFSDFEDMASHHIKSGGNNKPSYQFVLDSFGEFFYSSLPKKDSLFALNGMYPEEILHEKPSDKNIKSMENFMRRAR